MKLLFLLVITMLIFIASCSGGDTISAPNTSSSSSIGNLPDSNLIDSLSNKTINDSLDSSAIVNLIDSNLTDSILNKIINDSLDSSAIGNWLDSNIIDSILNKTMHDSMKLQLIDSMFKNTKIDSIAINPLLNLMKNYKPASQNDIIGTFTSFDNFDFYPMNDSLTIKQNFDTTEVERLIITADSVINYAVTADTSILDFKTAYTTIQDGEFLTEDGTVDIFSSNDTIAILTPDRNFIKFLKN